MTQPIQSLGFARRLRDQRPNPTYPYAFLRKDEIVTPVAVVLLFLTAGSYEHLPQEAFLRPPNSSIISNLSSRSYLNSLTLHLHNGRTNDRTQVGPGLVSHTLLPFQSPAKSVRLFQCGQYSDLTIVCGAKRYPVHRILLATRSTFFEGACRNGFREAETGVIDLTEDDAEAVDHMVHCTY